MARPVIYYDNLFSIGTLSGEHSTTDNPVRQVGDGSINLDYQVTSGTTPTGFFQVTLPTAQAPDALVFARAELVSGHRIILESEDVGGGNNATILDFTLTSGVDRLVSGITGATARRVWRLTISGVQAGLSQAQVHEAMLATKLELPRSPIVGVERARMRQFTRVPVPGGQPFVKRDGPRLRRTGYTFALTSGTQVSDVETFVDAVDGGQAFFLVDDLQQSYFAELLGTDVGFDDQAGEFGLQLTFLEVRADA